VHTANQVPGGMAAFEELLHGELAGGLGAPLESLLAQHDEFSPSSIGPRRSRPARPGWYQGGGSAADWMLSTDAPENPAPQNQPCLLKNGASCKIPRCVLRVP